MASATPASADLRGANRVVELRDASSHAHADGESTTKSVRWPECPAQTRRCRVSEEGRREGPANPRACVDVSRRECARIQKKMGCSLDTARGIKQWLRNGGHLLAGDISRRRCIAGL